MAFEWKTFQKEEKPIRQPPALIEEMIILGRLEHTNELVGCCGLVRKDTIFPVGSYKDFEQFKKDALSLLKEYDIKKDTYSLEHFYGSPGQNFRENGDSIYLLRLENGLWNFYEHGTSMLSFTDSEELIALWQD